MAKTYLKDPNAFIKNSSNTDYAEKIWMNIILRKIERSF